MPKVTISMWDGISILITNKKIKQQVYIILNLKRHP